MSNREFFDLTHRKLLAQRYVVWGLGLFAMPPLLISCHLAQFLCQASWDGDIVAPLIALWAVFPWLLPIALVMLGGVGMAALGGILFLSPYVFRGSPSMRFKRSHSGRAPA
jgi:hypothetical protein